MTIDDWDIGSSCGFGFDLVVAHNVLHYMREPARVLANLMRSGRYVWIQDLIDRDRGELGFASDGDAMRYSFTPHFKSGYEGAFDLAAIAGHVTDFHAYPAERARGQVMARHFTAVLTSGSLAERLPARPYSRSRQVYRRARLGLSHLRNLLIQPGSPPISPPPVARSGSPRARPKGGSHA
jgi:hypothetical protein